MKVVFVASEMYPFAKTGGLADISGSLPVKMAKFGIRTFAFMPLYKTVNTEKFGIKSIDVNIDVYLNGKKYTFQVYKLVDGATFFFLKNDELFGRDYLYGPPEGDYPDNDIRFGAFSYAVMEFIKRENLNPDIIHVNDWQTSLIPVLTYYKYGWHDVKTVLTIHNLAYQGIFDKYSIERLNLGWDIFHMEALEFYDKVNFLKGGIVFSSVITTVSPTYAKEILSPENGYGLDGILRKYENKLFGIINGIDYDVWNPESDKHLYEKYCSYTLSKKSINKKLFLKDIGLENPEKPLFIFIGRLAYQKGIDLIKESIEELSKLPITFVLLGSGDKHYNDFFESIKNRYENIYIKVGYDEDFSRKMYGSADFLLMPSLFEPCGLNQMIAMRYGTLVVARKTGGLNDTVKDISQNDGYGVLFEKADKYEFLNAVNRAIDLYNNRPKFSELQKKVMNLDFSIENTTSKYIKLYESVKYSREVNL